MKKKTETFPSSFEDYKLAATKLLWHRYMLDLDEFAEESVIRGAFEGKDPVDNFVDWVGEDCDRVDCNWGPHQNVTVEEAWEKKTGKKSVSTKCITIHDVENDGRGPVPPLPKGFCRYMDYSCIGSDDHKNNDKKLRKGLYLSLFHGRLDPKAELQDWGHNGPMIGPLRYIQETYAGGLRFEFIDDKVRDAFIKAFPELDEEKDDCCHLKYDGDMVVCGGYYYGDVSIATY